MSGTMNNKDHSGAVTSLLSLSQQATVPSTSDAVTKQDKSEKSKSEQSKPTNVPAKKDEPKEKETPANNAAAPQETLTEAAVKHLKNAAKMVSTASAGMTSPPESAPAVDPPKGWDREVQSILAPSEEPAEKSETKQPENEVPASDKTDAVNKEDSIKSDKDATEEAEEDSIPRRKRRVASKSVGSSAGNGDGGSKRTKKVSAKSVLKGDTLAGTWSSLDAEGKDKKRKAEKKEATPKKKQKKPRASPAEPKMAPKEVYHGEPEPGDKLASGEPWPPGWTKKKFQRRGGVAKGRPDPYWFTPIEKKKLRSMKEVNRFMEALKKTNGDESKAWAAFKK